MVSIMHCGCIDPGSIPGTVKSFYEIGMHLTTGTSSVIRSLHPKAIRSAAVMISIDSAHNSQETLDGPRVVTVFLCLHDVEEGGGTDFPSIGNGITVPLSRKRSKYQ